MRLVVLDLDSPHVRTRFFFHYHELTRHHSLLIDTPTITGEADGVWLSFILVLFWGAPNPNNLLPRKVVTDFATFGAPPTSSVFETAGKSGPFTLAGSNSAFAAIRGGRGGMDEEDEDEGEDTPSVPGRQKIELREGSITFD